MISFYWSDPCLFRFRDKSTSSESSNKRYVITNPPSDFNLLPSDHVSSVDSVDGVYGGDGGDGGDGNSKQLNNYSF